MNVRPYTVATADQRPARDSGMMSLSVKLFRYAYGCDFLFLDDNARPHRVIPLPAKSPDLNSTEIFWDYLGKAVAWRHTLPRGVNAQKTTLLRE